MLPTFPRPPYQSMGYRIPGSRPCHTEVIPKFSPSKTLFSSADFWELENDTLEGVCSRVAAHFFRTRIPVFLALNRWLAAPISNVDPKRTGQRRGFRMMTRGSLRVQDSCMRGMMQPRIRAGTRAIVSCYKILPSAEDCRKLSFILSTS